MPTDWTHRHVIFSKPDTAEQQASVEKDPRYWQQLFRREVRVAMPTEAVDADSESGDSAEEAIDHIQNGLWEIDLGHGGGVGATNYPAKFSFLLKVANCGSAAQPDFAVYNTGLLGSATQASVVAFDNLYSGCGGVVPKTYWAFNTGGQVLTSVVYSVDGKQVAFVQTAGLEGSLVLLKWASSTTETITAPLTLSPVSLAAYSSCTAPCMTTILLTNLLGTPADDTTSSTFYDYGHDVAWVGDSHGWLHKFSPVFKGTPAEVRSGGWPVQVNPSNPNALTDPVNDSLSGNLLLGDAGGFVYRVTPAGVVTKSAQLDFGTGIVQGPFVDSTAGLIYVFTSSDNSAACAAGANCAAVYQLSNTFPAGSTGSKVQTGLSTKSGKPPNPMYLGTFDSAYENAVNATGNLYVCGNTGGAPTVYQIPIVGGLMGTPIAGPVLASITTPCSPLTDVPNPNVPGGATEWIFAGVRAGGLSICRFAGCAYNFKITPWKPLISYSVGQEVLDTHLQIQVVTKAGISGALTPLWATVIDLPTADGTVIWTDQGAASVAPPVAWAASHAYAVGNQVLDTNNNLQYVIVAGTSGAAHPVWSATAGTPTTDNTVVWTNIGSTATAALVAAGGSSGFIIDNFVETLAGASQVYYSTLGNQNCTLTGVGGCAVQASQSALK